jgi:hypothetical protein
MSTRKIGYSLIGIGIFVIVVMLFADLIGLGSDGIQAAQLLGVGTGIIAALLGYLFIVASQETPSSGKSLPAWVGQFLSSPITAVLVGMLLAYFIFSIVPMFLNSDMRIQYFNRYLPDKYPIGLDLETLLNRVKTWFEVQTPYPGDIPQFYPPLTYVFFSPLTLVSYRSAYLIMTLVTLFSYVLLTLLLPIWMNPKRNYSLVFFLFAVGLFSYGLQFELERGQYNVLTFLFCIAAVYIYHFHQKFRYIAYLLFSIAVQLKVFPAIFIFMFIRDWKDWKSNIKRFIGIGLFNLALLFILGYRVFLDFMNAITTQVVTPSWNWNGNHSIQAFVFNLMKDGYGLVQPETLASLSNYSSMITTALMLVFALCLISLSVSAYRHNEPGLNPYLLLVCTIGALIVPTSNDYTLSFLIAPVAILFASIPLANAFRAKYFASLLIALVSFAFASTLFPFKYKPYFLNNNFPALFIVLVSVTILYFLRNRNTESTAIMDNI